MQSTHKIAGTAAAGFAAYLTTSASRGDYYVGGELEGDGGAWHGSPEALGELGLDASLPVRKTDLVSLMGGRSPASGEPIRRVGGDGSRVAGIDATFSAPKSVSALWAVSDPYRRAQIEVAHRKAVASALNRIERDVELVRRRERGELRWEKARSLVAAEFVHTSSRLTRDQERDGVPDPQLHSHVVILAAEREDRRFAAVDSRELFRSQRANGAWYRAELAHELRGLGLEIRRRTGRDGRFFELRGVPEELSKRWSRRREVIEKAACEFRDRYGRSPNRGELGSIAVATRGTKTVTSEVDVSTAWRAVGEEYGLSRERVERLFNDRSREHDREPEREIRAELLADITRTRSMVETRELEARAFELAAGVERPDAAKQHLAGLERSGELVRLEDGSWTTRELRELEQRTLVTAFERSGERVGSVTIDARDAAFYASLERHGYSLTYEQRDAINELTGRGGVVVLVGEAGTGKGTVLDAARVAWEQEGNRVIGTAIAGATAQRLAVDAGIGETMTADSLIHRVEHDRLKLDERTVVVMDEAGMADTRRLARLIELTDQTRSKLVLAGDPAQLSPIGAGGLFRELKDAVPTAELTEMFRAHHEWERQAWGQLRDGQAQRALASYQARDRLHIAETREQAGERMVKDWAVVSAEHPRDRVVMITDASNHELDRLNELAQQERIDRGELGQHQVELPDRPYSLRAGDQVIFTSQHPVPGERRVENGTRGEVIEANDREQQVVIRTQEPKPRELDVSPKEYDGLRLAYAQHVYKAQGLTTDRALVLTGGWQTDRETTYVALTRAREQTDIYTSREDLGHAGIDKDAVDRVAERMRESHAQEASITREQHPDDQLELTVQEALDRLDPPTENFDSWFARQVSEIREHQHEQHERLSGRDNDHERGAGSERDSSETWFAREVREIREQQHRQYERLSERDHNRDRDQGRETISFSERISRARIERGDFQPDPSLSLSDRLRQFHEWKAARERGNEPDNDRSRDPEGPYSEQLRAIRELKAERARDRDNDRGHGFEI
jgi:conjugative relaxase-like TrwC/TraI family protein